ncbi:hypothetical protein FJT64_016987 [Amphibalanus amphitrite]|uniref:HAT C-terminal dimerisation domain-containing protein n=1 Tax=Amphibalanus amphitrite TaxID=1232801 RepID=A0A6A4X7W8_AMPAM|nr:hypothetical protein FJT64_016987 [Amphibalanus amphitrite]
MLDTALQKLRQFFVNNKDLLQYQAMENVLLTGAIPPETEVPREPTINYSRLENEHKAFHRQHHFKTTEEAAAILLDSNLRDIYVETVKFLDVLVCVAVSSAEAERCFSKLRRVKSWLRSTMTEKRLSDLLICHVHQELLDRVEIAKVVKAFVTDDHRRRVFGDV